MLPLDSTLLKQAAASHRQFVTATEQFLSEFQPHWAQAFSLATGQAYDAGKDTLGEIVESMVAEWAKSHKLATYLELTAEAQRDVERKLHLVSSMARALGLAVEGPVVVPVTPAAINVVATFQQVINAIYAWAKLLDTACAWEVTALSGCSLPPDPKATLLAEWEMSELPELRLATQHSEAVTQAPPEIAQLLADNPEAQLLQVSKNNFAVVLGDPYTADVVSTVYGGVGSAEPNQWAGDLDRLKEFHGTVVGAVAPEKIRTATVMFVNLDSPSSLPAAVSPMPSIKGAEQVQMFQQALAQANPQAKQVALGHSLGSVTLALAGQRPGGLAADTMINVGSPGNRAPSAHAIELTGENPRIISAINDADPIRMVPDIHGPAPHAPEYGAEVWHLHGDHSSYFRDRAFQHLVAKEVRRLARSE